MFLQFSVYIMQLLGCLCDEPGPLWLYVCMTRLVKRNYLVPTFSHYLSDSQSNKHEYICRGLHTPHSILMLDYLLCFNM